MIFVTKLLDCMRMKDPEQAAVAQDLEGSTHNMPIYCPEAAYHPSKDNMIDVYRYESEDRHTFLEYIKPRRQGKTYLFGSRVVVSMASIVFCIAFCLNTDCIGWAIGAWASIIALLLLLDPLDVVCRVMAPQSRVLLCFVVVLYICGSFWSEKILATACILSLLIIPTVYMKNKEWLMVHNWYMSESVEKSLRVDSDSRAVNSWVYGGRKEAYTVLHEIGYRYGINNLDGWAKPLYTLGYWNGCKYGMKVEELEAEVKLWKGQSETLGKRLEELQTDKEDETREAELERILYEQNKYITSLEAQKRHLEDECNKYKGMYSKTTQEATEQPTERMKEVYDPIPSISQTDNIILLSKEETIEDNESIIKEIIDSKLSIRKAAEQLGIKAWKVEHVRKAAKMIKNGETLENIKEKTNLTEGEITEILEYIA